MVPWMTGDAPPSGAHLLATTSIAQASALSTPESAETSNQDRRARTAPWSGHTLILTFTSGCHSSGRS
jgi:hypothetical protein